MPYYPPPTTGFVPLNGSLPMTGTLTTPAVNASSPGTAVNPAFQVFNGYGIFFDSTNNATAIATGGVESSWFTPGGLTIQRAGAGEQISVTSEAATSILATRITTDTLAAQINSRKARGIIATPLVVAQNDIVMTMQGQGWDGVSAFQSASQLRTVVIEPTPSPTAMGGSFRFLVTTLGTLTQTEVARYEPATGFSMYGANAVVDSNRTVIAASSTTAGLPTYVAGGLRYVTDLEGGAGVTFGGIGGVYRNIMDGQVATATVSGVGVLTEFTGFCNYTYRTIVQNTHAMLTSAGLLAKLTGFHVFAVPTNQNDALINWATPGVRNATITGTPTWTANQGFTGDSATALINAGANTWAPYGASQNNITVGCYVLAANTAGAAERPVIGQNNNVQARRTYLTSFTSGALHSTLSFQSATGDAWTPSRYTGLFTVTRNISTAYNDSLDDVAATTLAITSNVLGSATCWLGTNDSSGTAFSNAQIAFAFIGVGLTTTDIATLRTIMRDYYLVQIGALSANYTVALLPLVTTVPTGTRYNVTDATVTTFASTVVGGGTNFVPVINNGTNWIIG